MDAYYFVLSYKLNSKLIERALLGLGQIFDDQITSQKTKNLYPIFMITIYFLKIHFKDLFIYIYRAFRIELKPL